MKNFILLTALLFSTVIQAYPVGVKGVSQSAATYPSMVKVPNSQATKTPTGTLIETGNDNILVNPGFEDTALTGWTCTTGTCTSTTTSGEVSEGLAAYKITSGAPTAINASQSVATISGSITQYVVGVNYKVDSTMTDFQVCTLIAGSEKTCVPSANLILDNAYHTIEIPEVITPGSTVGIKVKTTATYSGKIAFIDKAYIKQGLGSQALQLDNVYSAKVSSTGVVTDENKEFISGNCVVTATSVSTCTFTTGVFSVAPTCSATSEIEQSVIKVTTSSTAFVTKTNDSSTGTAVAKNYQIVCQKTGNDYLASSSSVYNQASANYPYINLGSATVTAVTSNPTKGTVVVDRFWARRDGQMLEGLYQYQQSATGAAGSGEYIFSLPTGYAFDTSIITPYAGSAMNSSNTAISLANVGSGMIAGSGAAQTNNCRLVAYSSTQYRAFCTGANGNAAAAQYLVSSAQMGFTESATMSYSFNIRAPISGWSNSSNITASFAGVPAAPGVSGSVDTLVFFFAANSSLNTTCTTPGACYLDQFGTGVTSVTRTASTGIYTIVFARTYSKIACQFQGYNGTQAPDAPGTLFRATSTNTITLNSTLTGSNVSGDTLGTVICWGAY